MEKPGHVSTEINNVQVLRLLESFDFAHLHAAVKQAIQLGAIGFDAVKHLILCRVERRPPRLDLAIYPYLPRATVEREYPKLCVSDRAHAVFRYGQASKRPANIMAS